MELFDSVRNALGGDGSKDEEVEESGIKRGEKAHEKPRYTITRYVEP